MHEKSNPRVAPGRGSPKVARRRRENFSLFFEIFYLRISKRKFREFLMAKFPGEENLPKSESKTPDVSESNSGRPAGRPEFFRSLLRPAGRSRGVDSKIPAGRPQLRPAGVLEPAGRAKLRAFWNFFLPCKFIGQPLQILANFWPFAFSRNSRLKRPILRPLSRLCKSWAKWPRNRPF